LVLFVTPKKTKAKRCEWVISLHGEGSTRLVSVSLVNCCLWL
jgi:hypothetical protein